jgi:hypothetical protein
VLLGRPFRFPVEPQAASVRKTPCLHSRHPGPGLLARTPAEAETELEAATGRSDINAAAKRLQRAKAELKRLEAEATGYLRPGSLRRSTNCRGDMTSIPRFCRSHGAVRH